MHLSLKRNVGTVDRLLRAILGLVLIYMAAFQSLSLGGGLLILLGAVGVVMLLEGLVGY